MSGYRSRGPEDGKSFNREAGLSPTSRSAASRRICKIWWAPILAGYASLNNNYEYNYSVQVTNPVVLRDHYKR